MMEDGDIVAGGRPRTDVRAFSLSVSVESGPGGIPAPPEGMPVRLFGVGGIMIRDILVSSIKLCKTRCQ